jgi:hypothetical protein
MTGFYNPLYIATIGFVSGGGANVSNGMGQSLLLVLGIMFFLMHNAFASQGCELARSVYQVIEAPGQTAKVFVHFKTINCFASRKRQANSNFECLEIRSTQQWARHRIDGHA